AFDEEVGTELGGERLDALLQRISWIAKGYLGALGVQGLGDTPGNGAVVGDAHDKAALACHKSFSHRGIPPGDRCCWPSATRGGEGQVGPLGASDILPKVSECR